MDDKSCSIMPHKGAYAIESRKRVKKYQDSKIKTDKCHPKHIIFMWDPLNRFESVIDRDLRTYEKWKNEAIRRKTIKSKIKIANKSLTKTQKLKSATEQCSIISDRTNVLRSSTVTLKLRDPWRKTRPESQNLGSTRTYW